VRAEPEPVEEARTSRVAQRDHLTRFASLSDLAPQRRRGMPLTPQPPLPIDHGARGEQDNSLRSPTSAQSGGLTRTPDPASGRGHTVQGVAS